MRSAMILLLASLALALFLSGCVTSPARGVSHASDLDVLVLGVKAMLAPREPAGTVKLAEDAENVEQAWGLLLDLEEVDWLHEQDKLRTIDFVMKGVERIKESRRPCSTVDKLFNLRECS